MCVHINAFWLETTGFYPNINVFRDGDGKGEDDEPHANPTLTGPS